MVDYRDKAKQTSIEDTILRFHAVITGVPPKDCLDCGINLINTSELIDRRLGYFDQLQMLKDTESEVHTSRMIDKLRDSYNALNKTKKIDEKATQQTQPVQTQTQAEQQQFASLFLSVDFVNQYRAKLPRSASEKPKSDVKALFGESFFNDLKLNSTVQQPQKQRLILGNSQDQVTLNARNRLQKIESVEKEDQSFQPRLVEKLRKQYLIDVRQKRQKHQAQVEDSKLNGRRVAEYDFHQESERFKIMSERYFKQDRLLPSVFKNVASAACQRTISVNQLIQREIQMSEAQKPKNSKVEDSISLKIVEDSGSKSQHQFRQELINLMGGAVIPEVEEDYTQTVLFGCQREPGTCFYRTSADKKEQSRHGSAEDGSTSFYQNSARPSSSSFQSALCGGYVTADGICHQQDLPASKTGLMESTEPDFRRSDFVHIDRDSEWVKFKADDRGKKTPMPLKDTKSTLQFKGGVFQVPQQEETIETSSDSQKKPGFFGKLKGLFK